jgi:hypothetical protein
VSERLGTDRAAALEIGDYCRRVEDALTRANGGHLVRIVGPGFELVRGWAAEGVPLGIVRRGIEQKAERHRKGRAVRPLRIEFCEGDVRALFDAWRRAVGVFQSPESTDARNLPARAGRAGRTRRTSLPKDIDRVMDRLTRAAGRRDLPDALGDAIGTLLAELAALREGARGARGEARQAILARLGELHGRLAAEARAATPQTVLGALRREAEQDLAAYRDRLPVAAWRQAMDVTVDRLLRDHYGLPYA